MPSNIQALSFFDKLISAALQETSPLILAFSAALESQDFNDANARMENISEEDLALLAKFFAEFPDYLINLNEEALQKFIPAITAEMTQQLKQQALTTSVHDEDYSHIKFAKEFINILNAEALAEIATLHLARVLIRTKVVISHRYFTTSDLFLMVNFIGPLCFYRNILLMSRVINWFACSLIC